MVVARSHPVSADVAGRVVPELLNQKVLSLINRGRTDWHEQLSFDGLAELVGLGPGTGFIKFTDLVDYGIVDK